MNQTKQISIYSTKGAFELKDMDSENRRVAVYLSTFNTIDSDNDMIMPGAFTKSLEERGVNSASNRKIAFLRHHNWEMQIGKWVELAQDEKGLYAVGELGRSTMGEDAFKDYEDGIIREHSIGFKYIADKIKWVEDSSMANKGYFQINEVKLYEGSAVTFGANEFTNVVEVKGEEKIEQAHKISNEIEILTKALANGKGTDERLHQIEMKLKYLNGQMLLLCKSEPDVKSHSRDEKPTETLKPFGWDQVIKSINF